MTADDVLKDAANTRPQQDAFDVAIAGCVELLTAGDFAGADRVTAQIFTTWQRTEQKHPGWADQYLAR